MLILTPDTDNICMYLLLWDLQIGPGIVYLTFSSIFGRGAYLQGLSPFEPVCQRLVHHIYFTWYTPTIVAKFFLYGEAMMVRYIPIRCTVSAVCWCALDMSVSFFFIVLTLYTLRYIVGCKYIDMCELFIMAKLEL